MLILNCVRSAYSVRIHQISIGKTSYLVNKSFSNGQVLSWRFSSKTEAFKFAHFLGVPKKVITKATNHQLSFFNTKTKR